MYKKIYSNNPYEIDKVCYSKIELPALTEKNSKFIEAIINLDSNYAKDSNIYNVPNKKYDPIINLNNAKGMYYGSTAYWFNEMKKNLDFERCLKGAIVAIDNVNSTHLSACINGREETYKRIIDRCKNLEGLRNALKEDFSLNDKNHLIYVLSDSLLKIGRNTETFNISFASKFCSYAAYYLNDEIKFSRYDKIVAENLNNYYYVYSSNNEKRDTKRYKTDNVEKRNNNKHLSKLIKYNDYCNDIKIIIENVKLYENQTLTIDDFDHIVWYCNK